jgi:hypothetical protein
MILDITESKQLLASNTTIVDRVEDSRRRTVADDDEYRFPRRLGNLSYHHSDYPSRDYLAVYKGPINGF